MPSDHLLATVSALRNGLTSLPLGSAMDNTETWQQQFLQSGQPGLQDIAREIGNLQSLLSGGALSARVRRIRKPIRRRRVAWLPMPAPGRSRAMRWFARSRPTCSATGDLFGSC